MMTALEVETPKSFFINIFFCFFILKEACPLRRSILATSSGNAASCSDPCSLEIGPRGKGGSHPT